MNSIAVLNIPTRTVEAEMNIELARLTYVLIKILHICL